MKVSKIQCDNPFCFSTGDPEWENGTEHGAPYGWWAGEVRCVGPGPNVEIECCSTECISPAVEAKIVREYEDEREEMERRTREFQAHVLDTLCRHCGAGRGEKCTTRSGQVAANFHSDRINTARLDHG